MSWTDERVELLKKLWAEGLSASQIAKELGSITRNAVIGKVHRLGLSGRTKGPSQSRLSGQKRAARNPAYNGAAQRALTRANGRARPGMEDGGQRALPAQLEIEAPESRKLLLTDLNDQTCKWPHGDPATPDFHFCGHEVGETGPYCRYHALLAYQPMADRRRDRDRRFAL
jgi:GcrA cell cycle regulator